MANYFANLPAYRDPGGLEFAPLNNAVQNFGQTTRANAMAEYQAGRDKVQDARAGRAEGRAQAAFDQKKGEEAIKAYAGIYQHIKGLPEAERAQRLQQVTPYLAKLRQSIPDFDTDAQGMGVNPNDPSAIGELVLGMAMGPQQPKDPLDAEYKRAQITNLTAKNSLDESIARMLTGGDEPTPAPTNAMQPPMLRPQSYQGGSANPTGLQQTANTNAMAVAGQPQTGLQLAADDTPMEAEDGPPVATGPNPGAVYNLPGNEVVNTPMGKMSRDRARRLGMGLAAAGKGEAGRMMIDAASGGDQRMGKAANTVNDKAELSATNQIAILDRIKQSYNPEWLKIPTRIKLWGKALSEKFGTLNPKDADELKSYAKFRQSAWRNMNQVLKDLAGTAVTESEMKRQLLDLPDPGQGITDGDAPSVFESKLDGATAFAKSAIARSRYLRSQGFTGKPWEAGVAVEDMPGIINQRGQQIEQQLRQQNPGINPQSLEMQVDKTLKQEFGI
jgi:hypothetical protein